MSKLLFAGCRSDSVTVTAGTISEDTAYIDPAYSDAGVNFGSAGSIAVNFYDPAAAPALVRYSVGVGHTLYWHATIGMNFDSGFVGSCITFYDSADYPWLRMLWGGQLQYNHGSGGGPVWANIGVNTYGQPGSNRRVAPWDIIVTIDAGGAHSVAMGISGNPIIARVGFNQPLMTNLAYAILESIDGPGRPPPKVETVLSEILVTEDLSTVNAHVFTRRATGAGAHSQWTGTYADVNEVITDDSTANTATAAGLLQSYPMSNIALPDGYEILGAFHWLRGKNSGTAPANLQSLIRGGDGVDHQTGNLSGIDVLFGHFGARYNVDPATGLQWTAAGWNAPVQLGFVSEA